MPGKNVTINDVAAAAGVSRQTVTRAMNEMADIAPATRKRVLNAAEQLGYRPSRFASNLARQKHRSIGIVVESLRNPYYTDLAADIMDVATERGWQTTIATTTGQNVDEVVRELAMHVDAIVGYLMAPDELLQTAAPGLPIVRIDADPSARNTHVIELDIAEGMRQLIAEARERGSRRFAMIDCVVLGAAQGSTRRGLLHEIVDLEHVENSELTIEDGARALIRLREAAPAVDTVIAFNDLIGIGAIVGAHQIGLAVPGDIRIIGIDGLSLGEIMNPPLSTLAIDRPAIARAAAELIAADFGGTGGGVRRVSIAPQPVWRNSA
ncbi:LacI family DNA-binding transcriptional regulator [Nonomuraea sediminis]|uniref:LacI family DNA-binding transcriptional regulator n=1 Tax=Nonomuraea sediminis TaxID=2835864 RepID=UPI001BDBF3E8|nr:LacI family DNA-binding transcriptional regulator [Nonomuraea sediminis]